MARPMICFFQNGASGCALYIIQVPNEEIATARSVSTQSKSRSRRFSSIAAINACVGFRVLLYGYKATLHLKPGTRNLSLSRLGLRLRSEFRVRSGKVRKVNVVNGGRGELAAEAYVLDERDHRYFRFEGRGV